MKRTLSVLLLGAAALLGAPAAHAQGAVEQAKVFFDAGATAYAKGDFRVAIQAFEEAYRLSSRPAILFSMAQAYRRQYFIDRRPADLRLAVDLYKKYLVKVPQGGRTGDAAQALSELEGMLQRVGGDAADRASPGAEAPKTRVMVTSSIKESKVSLDGAKPVDLPLISEVKPGKHTIKVVAEGYFEEQREVLAVEGSLIPSDVVLREKPARVMVKSPQAAQITVDGRPMGATPLATPIEVTPGRHLIAVTRNGARPFTIEVELQHDELRKIDASLAITGQRRAAYGFFAVGAAGAAFGAVAAGVTLSNQKVANDLLAKKKTENISSSELATYNNALQSRDDWRKLAAAGFGAGVALAATGLLLYSFDQPVVTLGAPRLEDRPKKPRPKVDEAPIEISAVPALSPGLLGGVLIGRF